MVTSSEGGSTSRAIYEQIVNWAGTSLRPWQSDAVRRLLHSAEMSELDVAELADLCALDAGAEIALDQIPQGQPVTISDIPSNPSENAVTLRSVRHDGGVNRLRNGQILEFAPTGLTVYYGANGSGKSGYVRILKQMCFSRSDHNEIRPNAFAESGPAPSATVDYALVGQPASPLAWTSGTGSDSPLNSISVFDSDAARVQVARQLGAVYRPPALEIFQRLVTVYLTVRETL